MSKKDFGFKKKFVQLNLPSCPLVVFDPDKCEWTNMSKGDIEKNKAVNEIEALSKQIDN